MTQATPHSPWQEVLRWTRMSTPVNKGTLSSATRRIPQIASPWAIGVLGLGALGAGIAMRAMRPPHRSGRSSRFRSLLLSGVGESLRARVPGASPFDASVEVGEGFGKPALVSFDLSWPGGGAGASDSPGPVPPLGPDLLAEALDAATRALWDNPELAPVAIRGRIIASAGIPEEGGADAGGAGAESPRVRVLADMTALGFLDETARPEDLFARYGSPASDPSWMP